jgi:hypothetical protein
VHRTQYTKNKLTNKSSTTYSKSFGGYGLVEAAVSYLDYIYRIIYLTLYMNHLLIPVYLNIHCTYIEIIFTWHWIFCGYVFFLVIYCSLVIFFPPKMLLFKKAKCLFSSMKKKNVPVVHACPHIPMCDVTINVRVQVKHMSV